VHTQPAKRTGSSSSPESSVCHSGCGLLRRSAAFSRWASRADSGGPLPRPVCGAIEAAARLMRAAFMGVWLAREMMHAHSDVRVTILTILSASCELGVPSVSGVVALW
jgi:hypothetical protein